MHDNSISWNENWSFVNSDVTQDVTLPHTWNVQDGNTGGNNYLRGEFTYFKRLKLDNEYNGKLIYLEVLAANSISKVIVNDTMVQKHYGGYSRFRVNITDYLNVNGDNQILIKVDNSHVEEVYPLRADFTFYGGLYRGVNLITVDPLHIDLEDYGSDGVYISQELVSKEMASVKVDCHIVNHYDISKTVTVEYQLLDMEGELVEKKSMTSQVTEKTTFSKVFTIKDPKLWYSIKKPYLYKIKTSVLVGEQLVDERENNLGLRFFSVDPQQGFFLNGESFKLNGVSRHQDRAYKGWAISYEDQIEDIELIVEMGANAVRLAHYQHDSYFYDLCDQYGLIVWAEIPLISRSSNTDCTGENAKLQMLEMIRQNYNYSSIVFWGVQNEVTIDGQKNNIVNIVKELNDLVKSEDPYRLTTQAQVGHHLDDDPMNYMTDTVGYNKYYGWYHDRCEDFDLWLNLFNEINPSLSLAVSEYGVEGILEYHSETPIVKDYTEEYHALYHEKVLKIFNRHPELWGTFVWNMFDFASDRRDEGGRKGMNHKGLVTYDRQTRKDAFYYYKAVWSKKDVLYITAKRFKQRLDESVDIKIYTNRERATLYVNGIEVNNAETKDHIIIFKDVLLEKGSNQIKVVSGNLVDLATFDLVDELTSDYICHETAGSSVTNWFDRVEVNLDVGLNTIDYPEGMLTVDVMLSEIIENEEGRQLIYKYLPNLVNSTLFELSKDYSLSKLREYFQDVITDVVYYNLSAELNKIQKTIE
ncbi:MULTISPECIES: glycoside hydrolase family 2 protein [unclassified Fusibacter]|uniref:glycoside hydrolase family 2 protein n=1 Tax=unclassified Fusibacter TaxID=2624464 RepID=UPI0010136050|nr:MULTISPECIES: glycoside hydrolase family 2 TIM barrel-domain containing protein [unclassified Fusibacter]MCK8061623.1 beta-galactosidase [Fusibacter sp. A2]NPE23806.1 glycoside hydrolase family 2 protein [Fusibacter sp. A1]RXV58644.1 glycoside hydrolase family 2 protein [Fusibacter sp. A1]